MELQKKIIKLSVFIGLLSLFLLLLPIPGYINELSINILIGIFSSCLLVGITSFITYKQLKSELNLFIFTSMVQIFNILACLKKHIYLHTSTLAGNPKVKDFDFVLHLFNVAYQLQELDIQLANKEIFLLRISKSKIDRAIFNFYFNQLKPLISIPLNFAEELEKVHITTIDYLNSSPSLDDTAIQECRKKFSEEYYHVCITFYNSLNKNKDFELLDRYIISPKDLGLNLHERTTS